MINSIFHFGCLFHANCLFRTSIGLTKKDHRKKPQKNSSHTFHINLEIMHLHVVGCIQSWKKLGTLTRSNLSGKIRVRQKFDACLVIENYVERPPHPLTPGASVQTGLSRQIFFRPSNLTSYIFVAP